MGAAPTRQSIIRGGGSLTFGGQTWIDKEGINANIEIARQALTGSDFGTIDTFVTDKRGKISLTPIGRIDAARLAVLFPYFSTAKGTSIFGSTDKPIVIHSRAGKKLTFASGAITGLPDLYLGADRTALGAMELTALLANGGEWVENDFYTLESAAYVEPTIDRTEIKRVAYTGAWGTTFTGLIAKDAWTITQDLQVNDETLADFGTIDQTFQDLTITAKCRPVNLDEDMLAEMRIQGAGCDIGSSESQGNNLVITGVGGLTVTLNDAMFIEGPLVWNGVELRAGEIAFQASRTNGTGALGSVAMTA